MLSHSKSSVKAELFIQNVFFLVRTNLRQDITMLLLPGDLSEKEHWPGYLSSSELSPYSPPLPGVAEQISLFAGLLRFTYLQSPASPQFRSWSLKLPVSSNAQSFQVSDTVITFLSSSGRYFLRARRSSSSCCIILCVPPLPFSHVLPLCTLSSYQ